MEKRWNAPTLQGIRFSSFLRALQAADLHFAHELQPNCNKNPLRLIVRHAILPKVDRLGAPLTQAVSFLSTRLFSFTDWI